MVTSGDLAAVGGQLRRVEAGAHLTTGRTSARHQPSPRHKPVTTFLRHIYPHIYLNIYYYVPSHISTHKHIISAGKMPVVLSVEGTEDPWHCNVTLHYVAVMSPQPAANSVQRGGETLKWTQPSIISLCCKDYL